MRFDRYDIYKVGNMEGRQLQNGGRFLPRRKTGPVPKNPKVEINSNVQRSEDSKWAVSARRAAFDIRMSDFFRSQLGSINLGSSFLFKIMVGAKRFHLFINLNKKQEGFL